MRDRIPDIIRGAGLQPRTHTADPEEYRVRLRHKLEEEVTEFVKADEHNSAEELADILEVVYALAAELDLTPEQLEQLRKKKAAERGGFTKGIVWAGNV
ncbi:nucleoside triphosphate pyrophosphohydrolase [Streptomyces sp. NBC_00258]|uniref:nucleoside triphosphate pyrophosphohydrolase n=1 Tax=Streptomyces sp. NBC_00258 TaxID=2903642 RepID=UPI002E29833B|nr:nucleoside triphosphate pyrophosphohydrolase [Streptomyces sp. NBC_00258]